MSNSLFALILAGGSGERFWPLSRRARPKQLLSLFSDRTLLQATLDRLEGLVPRENILILTNRDQEAGVRELLPELAEDQIVAEPAKRDTAAAVALGAGWIARRNPRASMIVLPADHLIRDTTAFQNTLRMAVAAAEESGDLVTIGISPTWACPGFGYIEVGEALPRHLPGGQVFKVKSFREKPDPELAEKFFKEGTFRWNAGMFVWTVASILSSLDRHAPELATFVERLHGATELPAFLDQHFPGLPKISIDYAVMEKAERVLMVEAAFDWDDVGGWVAVSKYLEASEGENASNTPLLAPHSSGNIVYTDSRPQVVLLGVHDLIVVQTRDALLVCRRSESERIKEVIRDLPEALQ